MDVAEIISIAALVVSIFSIYYAKKQTDASKIQAKAATDALKQDASWRAEEERRVKPRFSVTAKPIVSLLGAETLGGQDESPPLSEVNVVVKNESSRDATINHVGLKDVLGCSITHELVSDLDVEFPCRLKSGDLIEFSVPGREFLALLSDELPRESKFKVFVAKSEFFADKTQEEHWYSQPFTVRLPSGS
ncbi:MAG: hypothetical protein ACRDSH_05335 [Pseudonocardiaceae bacterium]